MANKTFEADRDGRLTIYPSLYESRKKGFVRTIIKKLVQSIFKLGN